MKKKQSVSFWAGAIMAASIAAICIISFFWMPADPEKMDTLNRFALPSAAHLLGTDQFGRDVLSRIMEASRWALLVGVCSVTVGALAGSIIGASAAMLKGAVRAVIMRFIDGMMSFPGILLAMMLVTVLGKGILGAVLAIGLFMVPTFSRLVYSMVLENKQRLWMQWRIYCVVSYAAGYASQTDYPIQLQHRRCCASGVLSFLFRIGDPASDAQLGHDAERGTAVCSELSVYCYCPGCGAPDYGVGV